MTIAPSRTLACAVLAAALGAAQAQPAPRPGEIRTCVDAKGRKYSGDRPIPECEGDQTLRNRDGSPRGVAARPETEDERTEREARKREADAATAAKRAAEREDSNLLKRFPNEAAHNLARQRALDDVDKSIRISEARIVDLLAKRKPLLDETEFYVGKPLPNVLKQALDANDALLKALESLIQGQKAEALRINQSKDIELEKLRKLWNPRTAGPASEPMRASAKAR